MTTQGETITVDLHGMRVNEAQFRLESLIESCGAETRRLVLIHGFHGGNALKEMIRGALSSPRIRRIENGENEGQTVLLLKKKKQVKRL